MKKLLYSVCFVVFIVIFLYVNNHWLVVSKHVFESEKVPASFEGLRIVQVSDLHDALFGDNQQRLIAKVKDTNPDYIFITGDVIDSNRYDLKQSLQAVKGLVEIADVYYVLGNHEVATNKVDEIYEALSSLGVHILANESTVLERDGERLAIVGIEDPLMGRSTADMLDIATAYLPNDMFKLLLAHRPEVFNTYVKYHMDLVFSGHAHGGQVRIPGLGGLVAPGQGLFPKYTAGVYEAGSTEMVVSRGLGNSSVPYRIFNLPEIIVMELKKK
ncbi:MULTISPECIES: metallophosphoesterase [Lysinibacillus]|uniref:Metallophosphoesterase n=1 Tax=Lysinibacillus fusiformis TaxID=28031 RepID=A0A2I0UW03_9BACI|nr:MULTISPECIES: metallophosphoesterase [Lysinibacillus]KUF35571.1 phosphoesterase [Lysinibacillus sp. F5]MEE3808891.1 metallophosphoesterase [Lysinibacillus fusiformis]PKU50209.1 metallophosphoesterase [Lysinibacillus fusiformis]WCH47985.1 metallophosphoesterase [Lysinibacillus sp. OF-1]